jgi:hypothetical protein
LFILTGCEEVHDEAPIDSIVEEREEIIIDSDVEEEIEEPFVDFISEEKEEEENSIHSVMEEIDEPFDDSIDELTTEKKEEFIIGSVVEKNPYYFQYLGMTFDELEKELGLGKKSADINYEMGYVVYEFGDSNIRFIFIHDFDDLLSAESKCQLIMVPLYEIIEAKDRTRIPRNELELLFDIHEWSETAGYIGSDDPWGYVHLFLGKYRGYKYTVYLDGEDDKNKDSAPIDTYVYFRYDSYLNDPEVNPPDSIYHKGANEE